jgi:hypothetical protein
LRTLTLCGLLLGQMQHVGIGDVADGLQVAGQQEHQPEAQRRASNGSGKAPLPEEKDGKPDHFVQPGAIAQSAGHLRLMVGHINEHSDTAQQFNPVSASPMQFPLINGKHAHSERSVAPGAETHLDREWRRRPRAGGG